MEGGMMQGLSVPLWLISRLFVVKFCVRIRPWRSKPNS